MASQMVAVHIMRTRRHASELKQPMSRPDKYCTDNQQPNVCPTVMLYQLQACTPLVTHLELHRPMMTVKITAAVTA